MLIVNVFLIKRKEKCITYV